MSLFKKYATTRLTGPIKERDPLHKAKSKMITDLKEQRSYVQKLDKGMNINELSKRWFSKGENEEYHLRLRYGRKSLTFENGDNSIIANGISGLIDLIDDVIKSIDNNESEIIEPLRTVSIRSKKPTMETNTNNNRKLLTAGKN